MSQGTALRYDPWPGSESVGRFAEVEAIAEEAKFAQAKSVVLAAAAELGMKQAERRSYLQMLLERSGAK